MAKNEAVRSIWISGGNSRIEDIDYPVTFEKPPSVSGKRFPSSLASENEKKRRIKEMQRKILRKDFDPKSILHEPVK